MHVIELTALAYGTDAIGRLDDGRVVFVPSGAPGDTVEVEIVEDGPRFARGRIVRVLEPSAHRVQSPCPFADLCGGCPWAHLDYETQLVWKRRSVVDALERIGGLTSADDLVAQAIPSPREWGYRNKVEFEATTRNGGFALGLHRPRSHEVTPIDRCLLLAERAQGAPKAITGALRFASGSGDLGIERVAIRVAENTGDLEIAFTTPAGSFPRAHVARIVGDAVKPTSLVRLLRTESRGRSRISKVEPLAGRGFWMERLGGFEYAISAPSFFQVNTLAADELVRLGVDALAPTGVDRIADLYSGAGTFTLPLSRDAGEVVAIESEGSSVRDLRRNLEMSRLDADVVGGDVARELPQLGHLDGAIIDPPRAGLGSGVVDALVASGMDRLVYVSCDPSTLARDLALLTAAAFRIGSVTPVDLFPQTHHIETVSVLERVG